MLGPDREAKVWLAGDRGPGWTGTLRDLGRGLKAVARDALRDGWSALRGPPQAVRHGGAWRCERCRQTTYLWLDQRDPDLRWHCGVCEPQPPPPPRKPARERAGTHNGGDHGSETS